MIEVCILFYRQLEGGIAATEELVEPDSVEEKPRGRAWFLTTQQRLRSSADCCIADELIQCG